MGSLNLVVGTDSTWSLRANICAKLANIELEETVIDLTKADYKSKIMAYSPAGLVPALVHNGAVIHDSLAIVEYLNELSDGLVYPHSQAERALARSLCSEMHAGFFQLRQNCPFTLNAVPKYEKVTVEMQHEIDRVESIFCAAKGEFMFEQPSAVDAFYAILAFRLKSYSIEFVGKAGDYQNSLLNWTLLKEAIETATRWRAQI